MTHSLESHAEGDYNSMWTAEQYAQLDRYRAHRDKMILADPAATPAEKHAAYVRHNKRS